MRSLRAVLAVAMLTSHLSVASPSAIPGLGLTGCNRQAAVSTYIGKDRNVLVEAINCHGALWPVLAHAGAAILPRQSNVCGATCTTNCFTPSGGGPDPNECHVISDALLYDSQNTGALFTMDPAQNTSVITMTFRSCTSFIVNQAGSALTYCRTDWSAVLDYVALNCQAQENASGGNCVATDQRWFIQVQRS